MVDGDNLLSLFNLSKFMKKILNYSVMYMFKILAYIYLLISTIMLTTSFLFDIVTGIILRGLRE